MSKPTQKQLKAWLNYNCSQGNNWITLYKIEEMISHKDKLYFETEKDDKIIPKKPEECKLVAKDMSHVYFTYMTESLMISLIETSDSKLYLIHNQLNVTDENDDDNTDEQDKGLTDKKLDVVEFKDEMVDNYKQSSETKLTKVINTPKLPQVHAIESKIYYLKELKHLLNCLSGKDLKAIGIRSKKWFQCELKKNQKEELGKMSYMDFIGISDEDHYVDQLNKYVDQSGEVLNLTNNYSVTPKLLGMMNLNKKVKQVIINQNFQIDDYDWLKKLPNVQLLNFWYNHRLEYKHVEQIVDILPELEVFNLHSCCRVNIRMLIPILKLKHLNKLAIDDVQFWCQKSIHELFILPDEWKDIYCGSLQKIAINSKNLTLDVVDYILHSCPSIQQFLVDDDILNMISRNVITGYDKETITFHSWQQPNKGLQINKRITFKNMFKDTYNTQLFSESMLRKIKEHKEKTGEKDQIPIMPTPKKVQN